jgi:hypothetical protein
MRRVGLVLWFVLLVSACTPVEWRPAELPYECEDGLVETNGTYLRCGA